MSKKPTADEPQSLLRITGMGTELAAAVLGFAAIGYWIDRSLESFPRGTAIGAVLGIIGGMYNFLREAVQLMREQTPKNRPSTQQPMPTHADQPQPTETLRNTNELSNTDDDQPDADT